MVEVGALRQWLLRMVTCVSRVDNAVLTLFEGLAEVMRLLREKLTAIISDGVWTLLLIAQAKITANFFTVPLLLLPRLAVFARL